MITLPEIGDAEMEAPKVSASGPAEYRVLFGTPCKVVANVRIDSISLRWPRISARGLVVLSGCEEFWPHVDSHVIAIGSEKSLYVLVEDVSEHRSEDSELVPIPRGVSWDYYAQLSGAAMCAVIRTMLNVDPDCKFYAKLRG